MEMDDAGWANKWSTGTWDDSVSGSSAGDRTAPGMTEQKQRGQDWITIWQSELSALAADAEVAESWRTVASLWAGGMSAMLRAMPEAARHDRPSGRAASHDAPRPAPFAASPDTRDVEITSLRREVSELERRLAALEHGGDLPAHGGNRTRRKPRK